MGKTTLAHKLAESSQLANDGYMYRHLSRPSPGFDKYWGYVQLSGRGTVYDRFHMSEVVYALCRGDDTMLMPETYRFVDGYLRMLGVYTVVVVHDDNDVLMKRHRQRACEEMYGAEMTAKCNDVFRAVESADGLILDEWSGRMDFDRFIHCSRDKPWPTDDDVQEILAEYEQRQSVLAHTLARGERCLTHRSLVSRGEW